jgi:hypothetical protein
MIVAIHTFYRERRRSRSGGYAFPKFLPVALYALLMVTV